MDVAMVVFVGGVDVVNGTVLGLCVTGCGCFWSKVYLEPMCGTDT